VLSTKPLSEVKSIVNAIPRPKAPNLAAGAVVGATRGQGQVDGAMAGLASTSPHAAEMDARMGLQAYEIGVRKTQHFMEFGVMPKSPATGSKDGAK
jgi:hypothetical protein